MYNDEDDELEQDNELDLLNDDEQQDDLSSSDFTGEDYSGYDFGNIEPEDFGNETALAQYSQLPSINEQPQQTTPEPSPEPARTGMTNEEAIAYYRNRLAEMQAQQEQAQQIELEKPSETDEDPAEVYERIGRNLAKLQYYGAIGENDIEAAKAQLAMVEIAARTSRWYKPLIQDAEQEMANAQTEDEYKAAQKKLLNLNAALKEESSIIANGIPDDVAYEYNVDRRNKEYYKNADDYLYDVANSIEQSLLVSGFLDEASARAGNEYLLAIKENPQAFFDEQGNLTEDGKVAARKLKTLIEEEAGSDVSAIIGDAPEDKLLGAVVSMNDNLAKALEAKNKTTSSDWTGRKHLSLEEAMLARGYDIADKRIKLNTADTYFGGLTRDSATEFNEGLKDYKWTVDLKHGLDKYGKDFVSVVSGIGIPYLIYRHASGQAKEDSQEQAALLAKINRSNIQALVKGIEYDADGNVSLLNNAQEKLKEAGLAMFSDIQDDGAGGKVIVSKKIVESICANRGITKEELLKSVQLSIGRQISPDTETASAGTLARDYLEVGKDGKVRVKYGLSFGAFDKPLLLYNPEAINSAKEYIKASGGTQADIDEFNQELEYARSKKREALFKKLYDRWETVGFPAWYEQVKREHPDMTREQQMDFAMMYWADNQGKIDSFLQWGAETGEGFVGMTAQFAGAVARGAAQAIPTISYLFEESMRRTHDALGITSLLESIGIKETAFLDMWRNASYDAGKLFEKAEDSITHGTYVMNWGTDVYNRSSEFDELHSEAAILAKNLTWFAADIAMSRGAGSLAKMAARGAVNAAMKQAAKQTAKAGLSTKFGNWMLERAGGKIVKNKEFQKQVYEVMKQQGFKGGQEAVAKSLASLDSSWVQTALREDAAKIATRTAATGAEEATASFADLFNHQTVNNVLKNGLNNAMAQMANEVGVTSYFVGKAGASIYASGIKHAEEEAVAVYCAINGIDPEEFESKVDEKTKDEIRTRARVKANFTMTAVATAGMITSYILNFQGSQNLPWVGKAIGEGTKRKVAMGAWSMPVTAGSKEAMRQYGGIFRTWGDMKTALMASGNISKKESIRIAARILGRSLANTYRAGLAESINDFADAATTSFLITLSQDGIDNVDLGDIINSAMDGGLIGFIGGAAGHNASWMVPKSPIVVEESLAKREMSSNVFLNAVWKRLNDKAGKEAQSVIETRAKKVRHDIDKLDQAIRRGENVEENKKAKVKLEAVEAELSSLHWSDVTPTVVARLFDGDDTIAQKLVELRKAGEKYGLRAMVAEVAKGQEDINIGLRKWLAKRAGTMEADLYEAQWYGLQLKNEADMRELGLFEDSPFELEEVIALKEKMTELQSRGADRKEALEAKEKTKEGLTDAEKSELNQITVFQKSAQKYADFLTKKQAAIEEAIRKIEEAGKAEAEKASEDAKKAGNESSKAKEDVKKKKEEIKRHKKKLAEAKRRKDGVLREIADLQAEVDSIQTDKTFDEQERNVKQIELNKLYPEDPKRAEVQKEFDKLQTQIERADKRIAGIEKRIEAKRQRIADIDEKSEATEEELKQSTEEAAQAEARYNAAAKTAERMSRIARGRTKSNFELTAERTERVAQAESELEAAQKELEAWQNVPQDSDEYASTQFLENWNAAMSRVSEAQKRLEQIQNEYIGVSEQGLLAEISGVDSAIDMRYRTLPQMTLDNSNPYREGSQAYNLYNNIVQQLKQYAGKDGEKGVNVDAMAARAIRNAGLDETNKEAIKDLIISPILRAMASRGVLKFKNANTVKISKTSVAHDMEPATSTAAAIESDLEIPAEDMEKTEAPRVNSETPVGNSSTPPHPTPAKPVDDGGEVNERTNEAANKSKPHKDFQLWMIGTLKSLNDKIGDSEQVPFNTLFDKMTELLVGEEGYRPIEEADVLEFINKTAFDEETKAYLSSEGLQEVMKALSLIKVGTQYRFQLTNRISEQMARTTDALKKKYGDVFDPIKNSNVMQAFDRIVDEAKGEAGEYLLKELATLGMATDGTYTSLADEAFIAALKKNYAGTESMEVLSRVIDWLNSAGVLADVSIRPIINEAMAKTQSKGVTFRNGERNGHHQYIIEVNVGKNFDVAGHILEQLTHEIAHVFFSEVAFKNPRISRALADVAIEARAQILMNQVAILAQFQSQFWMLPPELREQAALNLQNMLYGVGLELRYEVKEMADGDVSYNFGFVESEEAWHPQEFYAVALSNRMMNWALQIVGNKAEAAVQELQDLRSGRQLLGLIKGTYTYGTNREEDERMWKDTLSLIDELCHLERNGETANTEAMEAMVHAINKGIKDSMSFWEHSAIGFTKGIGKNRAGFGEAFNSGMTYHDGKMHNVIGPHAKTWAKYAGKRFKGRDDGMERAEIDASKAKLSDSYKNLPKEGNAFVSLGDVMSFDELFDAYPDIRSFKTLLYKDKDISAGGGIYHTKEYGEVLLVNVNFGGEDEIISSLLHEVQHIIQEIEGFAVGGNGKDAQEKEAYAKTLEVRLALQSLDLASEAKALAIEFVEAGEDVFSMAFRENKRLAEKMDSFVRKAKTEKEKELIKEYIIAYVSMNDGRFSPNIYNKLAGEIESRNVQSRLGMTAEERAATPFNETLEYPGEAIVIGTNGGNAAFNRVNTAATLKQNDGVVAARNGVLVDMRGDAMYNIGARHASPAAGIRKFSTEFLGRGEGHQAYGYGIYFSTSKDVHEYYMRKFAARLGERDHFERNGEKLTSDEADLLIEKINDLANEGSFVKLNHSFQDAVKEVNRYISRAEGEADRLEALLKECEKFDFNHSYRESLREQIKYIIGSYIEGNPEYVAVSRIRSLRDIARKKRERLDEIISGVEFVPAKTGVASEYEVELNFDANDGNVLLLWDVDISDSSLYKLIENELGITIRGETGRDAYFSLIHYFIAKDPENETDYEDVEDLIAFDPHIAREYAKYASEWLHEKGFKGIEYLDGFSRDEGEGTYNYVVFSDDDIQIVRYNDAGEGWKEHIDETAKFPREGVRPMFNRVAQARKVYPKHEASAANPITQSHPVFDNLAGRTAQRLIEPHKAIELNGETYNYRRTESTPAFNLIGTRAKNYGKLYDSGRVPFRAKDGKMRIELDTDKCVWKHEFVDDQGNTHKYESPYKRVPILGRYLSWGNFMPTGKTYRLSDVLDYPELYEAYPEIGNIAIKRRLTLNGYDFGDYSQSKNLITLSNHLTLDEARNVILHEVQHVIQKIEGFSRGGDPRTWLFLVDKLDGEIVETDLPEEYVQSMTDEERQQKLQWMREDWKNSGDWRNSIIEGIEKCRDEAKERGESAGYSVYWRLLGEVESRTVEKRSKYTMEQRKEIPFEQDYDVSMNEIILRYNTGLDWLSYFSREKQAMELREHEERHAQERAERLADEGTPEYSRFLLDSMLADKLEVMRTSPFWKNATDIHYREGVMYNTVGPKAKGFKKRAKGVFEAPDGTLRRELDTSNVRIKDIFVSPKEYTKKYVEEHIAKAIAASKIGMPDLVKDFMETRKQAFKLTLQMNGKLNYAELQEAKAKRDEVQSHLDELSQDVDGKLSPLSKAAMRLANDELVASGYNRNQMLYKEKKVLQAFRNAILTGTQDAYQIAIKELFGPFRPAGISTKKLSEVIEYPELFECYPQLADLEMRIGNIRSRDSEGMEKYTLSKSKTLAGMQFLGENAIAINPTAGGPLDMKLTLIHELQHWIQEHEGWGTQEGTSGLEGVEYLTNPDEVDARTAELRSLMSEEERAEEPYLETYAKVLMNAQMGIDYSPWYHWMLKNDMGESQIGFQSEAVTDKNGNAMFNRTNSSAAISTMLQGEAEKQAEELGDTNVMFNKRTKPAPAKIGIGYKVFFRGKDGKLYPPMVANAGGADTPIGVWLDAEVAQATDPSKDGRPRVMRGGKGTSQSANKQGLALRPGWHLGDIPYATQFNRMDKETGKLELFPKDFVWAEVEYAADVDYQSEAMEYGYRHDESGNRIGKFRHAYAGLPKLPEDGYYRYRTNPRTSTDPWIITGSMKVNKILSRDEVEEIVRASGREPQRVEGDPPSQKAMFNRTNYGKAGAAPDFVRKQHDELVASINLRNEYDKVFPLDEDMTPEDIFKAIYIGEFLNSHGRTVNLFDNETVYRALQKNGMHKKRFSSEDVTDSFVFALMSALSDAKSQGRNIPDELLNTFNSLKSQEELEEFKEMIRSFIDDPAIEATGSDAGSAMLGGFMRLIGLNCHKKEIRDIDPMENNVPGVFSKLNQHMLAMSKARRFKMSRGKFDKTFVQRQREAGVFTPDTNDIVRRFVPAKAREALGLNWRNISTEGDFASEMKMIEMEMKVRRGYIGKMYHSFNNALKSFIARGETQEEQDRRAAIAGKVMGDTRPLYDHNQYKEIEEEFKAEMRVLGQDFTKQERTTEAKYSQIINGIVAEKKEAEKALRQKNKLIETRTNERAEPSVIEELKKEASELEAVVQEKQDKLDAARSAREQVLAQQRDNKKKQEQAIIQKASNKRDAIRKKIVSVIRAEQRQAKEQLQAMADDGNENAKELIRIMNSVRAQIDEDSKIRAKYDQDFAEQVQSSAGFYLSRLYLTSLTQGDEAEQRFKAVYKAMAGDKLYALHGRVERRAAEDIATKNIDQFTTDWKARIAEAVALDTYMEKLRDMVDEDPAAQEVLNALEKAIDNTSSFMSETFKLAKLVTKNKEMQKYYSGYAPYIMLGKDVRTVNGDTFEQAWVKSKVFRYITQPTLTESEFDYTDRIQEAAAEQQLDIVKAQDTAYSAARSVMSELENRAKFKEIYSFRRDAMAALQEKGMLRLLRDEGFGDLLDRLKAEYEAANEGESIPDGELIKSAAQHFIALSNNGDVKNPTGNNLIDRWIAASFSLGNTVNIMPAVDTLKNLLEPGEAEDLLGLATTTAEEAFINRLSDRALERGYVDGIDRVETHNKMVDDLLAMEHEALWDYVHSLYFEDEAGNNRTSIGGINDLKTRHDIPEEYMQLLGAQSLDNPNSLMDTVQMTLVRGLKASTKVALYEQTVDLFRNLESAGISFNGKPTEEQAEAFGHEATDYVKLDDSVSGWVPNGLTAITSNMYVLRSAVDGARFMYDNFHNNTDANSVIEDLSKSALFGYMPQRIIGAFNTMPLISGFTPMIRNFMGMIPMVAVPNAANLARWQATVCSGSRILSQFINCVGANIQKTFSDEVLFKSREEFYNLLDTYRELGVIESDALYSIRDTDWNLLEEYAVKHRPDNIGMKTLKGFEYLRGLMGKVYALPDCLGKIMAFEANFADLGDFWSFKDEYKAAVEKAKAAGISSADIQSNHLLLADYMDAATFDTMKKTAMLRMSFEQPSSLTTPDWVRHGIPIGKKDNSFVKTWKKTFNLVTQVNGPFVMFHYNMLRSVIKNLQYGFMDLKIGLQHGDVFGQAWSGMNRILSGASLLMTPFAKFTTGRLAQLGFTNTLLFFMNFGIDDERRKWRQVEYDNSELILKMIQAGVLEDYWDTQDGIVLVRENEKGEKQFQPVMTDFVNPFASYTSTARHLVEAIKTGDMDSVDRFCRSLLGPLCDHQLLLQRIININELNERRNVALPDGFGQADVKTDLLGVLGGVLFDNPKQFLDADERMSPGAGAIALAIGCLSTDLVKRLARIAKSAGEGDEAMRSALLGALGFGSIYPKDTVKATVTKFNKMEQAFNDAFYWLEYKEKRGELSPGAQKQLDNARAQREDTRMKFALISHILGAEEEWLQGLKKRTNIYRPAGVSKEAVKQSRQFVDEITKVQ